MGASTHIGRVGGLAFVLGVGAAIFAGQGEASAAPESEASASNRSVMASDSRRSSEARSQPRRSSPSSARTVGPARATAPPGGSPRLAGRTPNAAAATLRRPPTPAETPATTAPAPHSAPQRVTVELPPMPVDDGWSFTVSPDSMAAVAEDYIDAGGDLTDSPRFFFGELAVASLGDLAEVDPTPEQVRLSLGNLTASGYFGGIWLRDNLRAAPPETAAGADLTASAIGIRIFDAVAAGLVGVAATPNDWIVRTVARASVPVLLALYGYNRGYLEVLLENPPPGVPPRQDALTCEGFLDCGSSAFPLEIANRYDEALVKLARPPSLAWAEMSLWTSVLESATGAGRFVWELIANGGAFSSTSYQALVELSSAYLMVSRAAVLSSMLAYADGDADLGRSALRLQAGLWMWSGSYFGGLASAAPTGTLPAIVRPAIG